MSSTMTAEEIRTKGFEVLAKELGPVGFVRFLQQFEKGKGNYSRSRNKQVKNKTVKEILKGR